MTMTRRGWLLTAFIVTLLFQIGVLAGEYLVAAYPRWTGEEVRLKVRPVDPRSLFRGNYARLVYDISRLPTNLAEKEFRAGDVVYVRLVPNDQGIRTATGIHEEPGDDAVYIRGRVKSAADEYVLRYGIEAWFAPKKKALALEDELRDGGTAVIRVADSGRAALMAVEGSPDGDPVQGTGSR